MCRAIASGLQHVMNDLDAASAVIPTMLGRQKPEEAFEGSSALSVLQHWWVVLPCSLYGMLRCLSHLHDRMFPLRTVETDANDLTTALQPMWTALDMRTADMREALSLSLQKQLVQADSASREKATSERLELLTQVHKVHCVVALAVIPGARACERVIV